jgi:lactate dehydrogenase-like 2-hydroxyacid dehydrogenase
MDVSMPRILVTREWPASVEQALQSRFDVTLQRKPLDVAQWREALQEYDAICPCVADRVTAELFTGIKPKTRLLANYGVGFNHIDLAAAKANGIVVTNTPDVLTDATADLAMTLMLMLARRAGEGERQLRRGDWQGWYPTHMMGTAVTGATLGIIGMGRIGLAMASKAHYGFGMKILYHNRKPLGDLAISAMKAEYCGDIDDLLKRADFVALHCRGGPDTRHLLNAERIALMRKHAFLINTSRGDVVDETALIAALKEGRIAGAGLDVYEKEPAVPAELKAMENVVLLPHLGSATLETRTAMGMRVLSNLDAFFGGREVPDRVV